MVEVTIRLKDDLRYECMVDDEFAKAFELLKKKTKNIEKNRVIKELRAGVFFGLFNRFYQLRKMGLPMDWSISRADYEEYLSKGGTWENYAKILLYFKYIEEVGDVVYINHKHREGMEYFFEAIIEATRGIIYE